MKSMREVDLDTYSLSLLTAKEDILNPRSSTNWALFAYDGVMNRLKLADSGGGLKELTSKLHSRQPLYGMCRVGAAQSRIIMILWVGNEVDEYRRAECASHIPAIRAFFKEVHILLPAHTLDEITEERICSLVFNAAVGPQGPRARAGRRLEDRHATVGTNYKRTNAAAEIHRIQRDSFWAQAEKEEEERKKEDQRRAAEDRRQRERERLLQEQREAMERERRMNEKEQKIKEQRRIQAQMEAEARKQEKIKWKQQEKECEKEEIRARYSSSGSEHKAAQEAAALVSQRVENPREFFRQLSSSSGQTASRPKSLHPVRSPYRRLHRSQTDSIFSFAESPPPTSTSPYRTFPYFPTNPTTQIPTFFNETTTCSSHNGAMVSSKSQVQIYSPKLMETVTVSDAPRLKTPPLPPPKPEIKSPISVILDSLVFYPPPPAAEELQPEEPEILDEFPPPPPGFEDLPESPVDEPETHDDPLTPAFPPPCASVPEPPSRPLPALPVAPRMLTDLEPESDFSVRASVISTVEEEEEEDEESEMKIEGADAKDIERRGWEEGKGGEEEVEDGMIMEKHESEKESNGEIMEKCEHGKEQDEKILENSESEDKLDGNIMVKCGMEENQVGKSAEADGRRIEERKSEEKQDGNIMEELESEKDITGKIGEEFESNKKEDGNFFEEYMSELKPDGNIMEKKESEQDECGNNEDELESGKEEARKMLEECEAKLGGCIMGKGESEEDESEKIVEEFEGEKIQDAILMTENREITQKHEEDGNTLQDSEDETNIEEHEQNILDGLGKEQDLKNMEVMQYGNVMEEYGQANVQYKKELEKWEEEHESEKDTEAEKTEDHNMEKHVRENEKDQEILDNFGTDQIPNASIKLEYISEKEHDPEIMEAFDNEKELNGKSMEFGDIENIKYPKMEVGQQDGITVEKCAEENKSEKEKYKTMKELETDEIKQGSIVEENDSEEVQDWKINEAFDGEKGQDWKNVKVFETETTQYEKHLEECEEEHEHERMMVEKCEDDRSLGEHEHEQEQGGEIVWKMMESEEDGKDGKIIDVSDSEKEQDVTWIEAFEIEKIQDPKRIEGGQENEQDEKIIEKREQENESEKEKNEHEKHEEKREKEQNWKMIDDTESEIKQYIDMTEEREKDKEDKNREVFETVKIQYVNIMEECRQENLKIAENSQEKHERENKQHGKVIQTQDGLDKQEIESEKTQDEKIELEHMREKCCKAEERYENRKSLEDQESEKEEDWKMIEDYEAGRKQYGESMENHESDQEQDDMMKKQHNEGTSSVDVDKSVNVIVLRKHSYMEIQRDEKTGSDEETGNEKEQTEESSAETLISHHKPSFPESLAPKPLQYNDTSLPESISNNESKMPTIQVQSDPSNLRDFDLSVDSPGFTSAQPEAEQGLDKETHVTEETEMSDEVKTLESSNDLYEGINDETKTSLPETQARIGQSDEGEELGPVSQSLEEPGNDNEIAVDIKPCIIVPPDLTDAMSDVEEGQEASALITTDTDEPKHTSDPDQVNGNKKHEVLQKLQKRNGNNLSHEERKGNQ